LSESDPVDFVINKFMNDCCALNCDARKFMAALSQTLSSRTTFPFNITQCQ